MFQTKKHKAVSLGVWATVMLIGFYIGCQALADIGVTKFTQIGTITLPSGGLMYAFTYTLRDLIHKRLGKKWAHATIVTAGLFNVFQALFLWLLASLPAPAWFELGEAWRTIFSALPFITAGSILAEVISQIVDTEVYQWIWMKLGSKYQWVRVLGSNLVGLAVDGCLFAPLAFTILPWLFGPVLGLSSTGLIRPLSVSLQMGWWGKLVQVTIMFVSLPWIYLIKEDPTVRDQ